MELKIDNGDYGRMTIGQHADLYAEAGVLHLEVSMGGIVLDPEQAEEAAHYLLEWATKHPEGGGP